MDLNAKWLTLYSGAMFFVELFVAQLLFAIGFKRRKHFLLKLIGCSTAVLSVLVFIPDTNVALESLKYALAFGLFTIMMFVCYNATWNNALFATICAYAIQHIANSTVQIMRMIYDINSGILSIFINNYWYEGFPFTLIYFVLYTITSAIIFAAVYTAMYFIFIRRLKKSSQYKVESIRQTILSLTVLISTIILNLLNGRLLPDIPALASITMYIYAILCCVFAILVQFGLFEKSKLVYENEVLDHMLYTEAKRHQMSKENIDLINMKCHDLKKQMSMMRAVTSEEEREESLSEIENAIMFYDGLAKTGNESLDIVLSEKSLVCEKDKITLTYIADGEKLGFMNSADIYSLFSNALDNAIESVRNIADEGRRIISAKISAKEQMVKIDISNYYEGNVDFENGLPLTSSDDKHFHGFGVKSMKYITEKYNGNFLVSAENQIFSVQILLPIE